MDIDPKNIEAAATAIVSARISEMLGMNNYTLIASLVDHALKTKVDGQGKPSNYGNISFLDYLTHEKLREFAIAAVDDVLNNQREQFQAAVKESMISQADQLAGKMLQAMGEAIKVKWDSSITVRIKREDED